MWYWQDMGWWMLIGGIITLVFLGGIIALIVWAVKKVSERSDSATGEKRGALDIARERYAKGEITREQFEQMKKDLL